MLLADWARPFISSVTVEIRFPLLSVSLSNGLPLPDGGAEPEGGSIVVVDVATD